MDGFCGLGADEEVGFDVTSLMQPLGAVAQYGISTYETETKAKESAAAEGKKLSDAIAADSAAALASAKALTSAYLKSDSASIDATAAQRAQDAQLSAGAGLSTESQQKRAEAADKALDAAVKAAQAKPKDAYAAALVKGWTASANRAHSGAIVASDTQPKKGKGEGGGNFLTRPVVGPIPGWGVLAGGAGLLGVVGVVIKKVLFR